MLRKKISDYLKSKGIKKYWLAENIGVSGAWLCRALIGTETLPMTRVHQINLVLGTDFKEDTPAPDLLPHEQLEADKQKAKNLFKEP